MPAPDVPARPGDTTGHPAPFVTILGIRFFQGSVIEAIERLHAGGLLVVPAAPALKDLETDAEYREAVLNADLALADSAFMVLVWRLLRRTRMRRISGLEYLRALLLQPTFRRAGDALWVMAGPGDAQRNLDWLHGQGIDLPASHVYTAPLYDRPVDDPDLLALIERLRPLHVVLTVGGGTQEQLGFYLKRNLSYLPAIHCVGAAIAFLTGVQVRIPVWADYLYLGWLFRSVSHPTRFVPRYWAALRLFGLIRRYGERVPLPLCE
jgi:UDP-N-acetyl-D-mannosaminuronic acid transferase (WecB/TagA/CpsF family)